MKGIILCAGYGTRLEKSIENDESGAYTHIKGVAKPLLPINGIPLICYWLETFVQCKDINEIIIVSNELHKKSYEEIVIQTPYRMPIRVLSDGSNCNEERSGAVNCMHIGAADMKDDCLFIAGDTLFDKDFKLRDIIGEFEKLKTEANLSCLILSSPVKDEDVSKHGIIEVNEAGRVNSFIEKPQPFETSSRLQSPCFYIIAAEYLHYIMKFLYDKKASPLTEKDATGEFISYLVSTSNVFARHVSKRFDIGSLDSYNECCDNFHGFK